MNRKYFGSMVVAALSLALTVLPVVAQSEESLPNTINIGGNDALGEFLVAENGMTLYVFERDGLGVSNCVEQCATNWPALTVELADDVTIDEAIPGEIGTIERADGAIQVTYNDQPLYFWSNDVEAGDALGHNFRNVWSVVTPATVYIRGNADLGAFLVGEMGMTVYTFANDEAGVSNCVDQCATNWPPVIVESEEALIAGTNLAGEFGVIERADGDATALQVTYNGQPLYYWVNDAARGDATGNGVGDVWAIVVPETVVTSSSDELGDYLVAANGYTLYTFTNDDAGVSNCVDQCATNWPPFTVGADEPFVAGAGVEGELATIERADGSFQVTYNDLPLYFWVNDTAPGETTGQGVGDVWFVAAP